MLTDTHVPDENANGMCAITLFQRVWGECGSAELVSVAKESHRLDFPVRTSHTLTFTFCFHTLNARAFCLSLS